MTDNNYIDKINFLNDIKDSYEFLSTVGMDKTGVAAVLRVLHRAEISLVGMSLDEFINLSSDS